MYRYCCRPDKHAAMSVDARQELDLKIGVAFSRLMTKAYLDMAREKFRSAHFSRLMTKVYLDRAREKFRSAHYVTSRPFSLSKA